MIHATAVIVAGGSGRRMGAGPRKQYLSVAGVPVLARTVAAFHACDTITRIYLVVPPEDMAYCRDEILEPAHFEKPVTLVAGGAERQESVHNGLRAVAAAEEVSREEVVAIHDGVRPFVTDEEITACIHAAVTGGAILATRAVDTLKRVDGEGGIEGTIPRETVWLAQTPQAFPLSVILDAHRRAEESGTAGTDDASLVEMAGGRVTVVEGSRRNIKITTPEDLLLAEAFVAAHPDTPRT